MDGPRDWNIEWSESDGERWISWYHLYVESKKKKKNCTKGTYLQNENRVTNVENKLTVTKGDIERGINWEIGTDIYTQLYIN